MIHTHNKVLRRTSRTTRTHAHLQALRRKGLVGLHWCPELCSSIDSRSTKLFLDPEQLQSRNRHCRCFSEYRLRNVNITRFGNASHIFSNYRELPRNCCTTAYLVVFGQALGTAGGPCLDLTLKPHWRGCYEWRYSEVSDVYVTRLDDSSTVARPTERSAMKVSSVSPLNKEEMK